MEEMSQEIRPQGSSSPQELETRSVGRMIKHPHPIQQEPIQLKTPKILVETAKTIMERHGCLVEEGRVTLPVGSRRTLLEQYLQTMTFWYEIVLPDQYHLLEAYDQHRDLSILFWQPE